MPRRLFFPVLVVGLLALTGCTELVGSLAGDSTFTIEYTPPEGFDQMDTKESPPTYLYEAGDGDTIIYSQAPNDRTQETFFSNETIRTMRSVYERYNGEGSFSGPYTTRFRGTRWLVMNVSVESSPPKQAMVFWTADDTRVHQFALYARGDNVEDRYGAFTASVRNITLKTG